MSETAFFGAWFRLRTFLYFGGTDNEKIAMARVALGVSMHIRFIGV